jgi:nitroimidazol reductase NimA-like FMN-containing flavoprotein (pyridoxamine 5'-phosphate oxidase superfamily)
MSSNAAGTVTQWSDEIDEILDGDHVVMLAYVTPAKGVVLLPVSNFGTRDREAGTISVNSSVAAWRKLERMRKNPRVALAFHTRAHALHDRSEFVLIQGDARLTEPIEDYPSTILERWERLEPWRDRNRFWRWWQRIYGIRVEIQVSVSRLVVWPDLECGGAPSFIGKAWPPEPPPPQPAPKKGTGPRTDASRAARKAAELDHVLLGWVGTDGYPVTVPVKVEGANEDGIVLKGPREMIPPGGRRAGLTAHWFSRGVVGQDQRKHTGWMRAEGEHEPVVYAPHTESNYRFPASPLLYRIVTGAGTRWWHRRAKRAGIAPG